MKVFAIGDLHLSGNPPKKPMTIFGHHWDNHWERIKASWESQVSPDDLVFLVGDMSWAMRLGEALEDLETIAALPGIKYMIRGNHDYWWSSATKMNQAMDHRIEFMQGQGAYINGIAFGGTRGYVCPDDEYFDESHDRSIYERELLRTRAALDAMEVAIGDKEVHSRILLLHYPPFNEVKIGSGFVDLLDEYHIDHCIFGHLHDRVSFQRIPSHIHNTQLHLVSADALSFSIKEIL